MIDLSDSEKGGSELSETDQKFLDGKRSHPEGETIAYCPECQKELDDWDFGTVGHEEGRCRSCGAVAWMSIEAQELLLSDFVTLSAFRDARSVDTDSDR